MEFIVEYCLALNRDKSIFGYNAKDLYDKNTLYIMPMVNPDGINLVQNAILKSSPAYTNAKNISNDYSWIPFPSGWKANIEGIDLNLQFPAGWNEAKEIKYNQGFISPAPRDFVGFGPLVAKESLAIYNFTLSHNFRLVICYHTQGKEIYWNYQNINPPYGLKLANEFSKVSGYDVANAVYNSSFAGFKDWFILNYNRPGFTIEAGLGQNPLPIDQFDEIYKDNLGILVLGLVLS